MLTIGTLPASIINLRTIGYFVPEGICILAIFIAAILLALPLVSHVNIISFENCGKKFRKNLGDIEPSIKNSPSFSPLRSAVSELSAVLQSQYPKPVRKSSEEFISKIEKNCSSIPKLLEIDEIFFSKFRPMFGESALVNYNSYRHKLIEETLQKQYGGGYAPGNVILNLIQLNTADSTSSVFLSKKYDRNFLDHIEFGDEYLSLCKRRESDLLDLEFPDPLAHFIPRNLRKASTTETHTETAPVSGISIISVKASARQNTPTISCQRIISNRSREANYATKSPYVTPIHSQSPLNGHSSLTQRNRDLKSSDSVKGEVNLLPNVILLRDQAPSTEQLYRRNDTRPDVVSKTHVEAEEYLNRIANTKRHEAAAATRHKVQEPRIKSSLKKSRRQVEGGKKFSDDKDQKVENGRTGDCEKIRRPIRDDVKRLSTSKPTIWNN